MSTEYVLKRNPAGGAKQNNIANVCKKTLVISQGLSMPVLLMNKMGKNNQKSNEFGEIGKNELKPEVSSVSSAFNLIF